MAPISVLDFREELDYGLTDDFQIALYLNHHYVDANDDVPVADPTHPKKRLPGISRMNRDACYKRVRVHPWTWRVLKSAQEFSRNTGGIFDITMAGQLVKWNYLPRYGTRFGRGSWRDIILEATGHVRFRRPSLIDFGGIAKGFAVDPAFLCEQNKFPRLLSRAREVSPLQQRGSAAWGGEGV